MIHDDQAVLELSVLHDAVEADVARIKLDEPYQPTSACGQCEHLAQPQSLTARLGHSYGLCPLLEKVRKLSDKPCRLYKEDCPF